MRHGGRRMIGLVAVVASVIAVLAIAIPGVTQPDPAKHGEQEECTNEHEADFTGQGANVSGAYDSTCDGRASENGNGNGNAEGKPCQGCVGNADNQNPQGQEPQGVAGADNNAGYECDRNNGIGKGNPAHTDCNPYPPRP